MSMLLILGSFLLNVLLSVSAFADAVGHPLRTVPQCKVGYTHNFAYTDPFQFKYSGRIDNWDFYFSSAWPLDAAGAYYHELEFRSTSAFPILEESGEVGYSAVRAVGLIIGKKNTTISEAENILSIRRLSLSYGIYRHFNLSEKLSLYVGSNFGIAKVLGYQGFRKDREDLYGSVVQSRIGLSYGFSSSMSAYFGYNYRRDSWKYKTDIIHDEDGNSVLYNFQSFRFSTHGIDVGLRFLVNNFFAKPPAEIIR